MSGTLLAHESVTQDWIDGLIVRWKTADDFIARLDTKEVPQMNALRRILRRDLPALIEELTRLRPDLGYPPIAEH